MQAGSGCISLNHSPDDLEKSLQVSSACMKRCFECKEHAMPREIVWFWRKMGEKNETVELKE
jgi:hypothetical protein